MEETISIEKTYTKKEAFKRLLYLYNNLSATENNQEDSEYNKLAKFLWIIDFIPYA